MEMEFWTDVSILNPLSSTYIGMVDPLPVRETSSYKAGKYGDNEKAVGAVFVPFLMHVYGGLAASAIEVMQMIAAKADGNGRVPYRTKQGHTPRRVRPGFAVIAVDRAFRG